MYDHRFSDYIRHRETVGKTYGKRLASCPEKGRQIARVIRVRTVFRVVMRSGFRKSVFAVTLAVTAAVDMKREYRAVAFSRSLRQSRNLGADDHAVFHLIEQDSAVYIRIFFASVHKRRRIGEPAEDKLRISEIIHISAPLRLFITVYTVVTLLFTA